MEKRKYEQPTIEIVELDVEDIITTSGLKWGPEPGDNEKDFSDLFK